MVDDDTAGDDASELSEVSQPSEAGDHRAPLVPRRLPLGLPFNIRVNLELAVNVAFALLFVAYWWMIFSARMSEAWSEWSADGDQAQAIFYYWRYHLDGVLSVDNPQTEFASIMHTPPFWWLLMATLSTVMEPLWAAKALNVIALGITPAILYLVVKQRSHHLVALGAAFLLMRSADFTTIIAGGYARTFGPFLVCLFLWAFMRGKHVACLVILVWQASFYPSVVIPCGFTYGAYVVVKGPMRERLRNCAGMFVAGLLIIAFGKYQDIRRPDWWGPLVWAAEVEDHPAWHRPRGRFQELPMRSWSDDLKRQGNRMFRFDGDVLFADWLVGYNRRNNNVIVWTPLFVCAVVIGVRRYRRWRSGTDPPPTRDRFPWQLGLLAAAALFSFVLARLMAFQLYAYVRATAHTWPYIFFAVAPLLGWHALRPLWPERRVRVALLSVLIGVVPTFALVGDGTGPTYTYQDYAVDKNLWLAGRELPKDATIAANIYHADRIPLFSVRNVYVNRTLTQPWRMGYYDECERRLIENYKALYATSFDYVLDFAEREKVDYFFYSPAQLGKFDKRLHEPYRKKLRPIYHQAQEQGLVMMDPPKASVIFHDEGRGVVIVEVAKLKQAVADERAAASAASAAAAAAAAAPDERTDEEP